MNGAAGGAVIAAMAQATKASGAIVRVEPKEFMLILGKSENPLIVRAQGGFIKKNYQYLTGYKGLIFFTKSPNPLDLNRKVEIIEARSIWIP
jgi:hypothetical protein